MSLLMLFISMFLVFGYLFTAIFCPIKSITGKTNLYHIPAGLAFILMSVIILLSNFGYYIDFFEYDYYYNFMDYFVQILYILQYAVFFPLLGILILSKASKTSLLAPIILWSLPYTLSFLNGIEHCDFEDVLMYMFWLLAIISLIVLIFARKHLKFAFFVPTVFMLINCFIEYAEYGIELSSLMRYDFWMITGLLLLGAYIVCDYPEKEKAVATPAPQPVYTQPVQPNYPPQNSGNNYRPQQTDIVQELGKYKNMLDSGLISEEEYEQMKKRLLGL